MKYVLLVTTCRDDHAPNSVLNLFKTLQAKYNSLNDIKLQNLCVQKLNEFASCAFKTSNFNAHPVTAFYFVICKCKINTFNNIFEN